MLPLKIIIIINLHSCKLCRQRHIGHDSDRQKSQKKLEIRIAFLTRILHMGVEHSPKKWVSRCHNSRMHTKHPEPELQPLWDPLHCAQGSKEYSELMPKGASSVSLIKQKPSAALSFPSSASHLMQGQEGAARAEVGAWAETSTQGR